MKWFRSFRSRRNRNPKSGEEQKKPFFSKSDDISSEKPFFSDSSKGKSVQTKGLKIGEPGDQYEKEADAMANAVVNQSNTQPGIQSKEENIQRTKLATPKEFEDMGTKDEAMRHEREIQEKPEEIQKQEEEEVQMQEEEEMQMQEEEEMQMQEEEEMQMQEEEEVQMQEEEEMQMQGGGRNANAGGGRNSSTRRRRRSPNET